MITWLRNVISAVGTTASALAVSMRWWLATYDPRRGTFTQQYEYPELPLRVAPRYRGFHRYDLTSCIACERCARDCPASCIYITKHRPPDAKHFQVTSFIIDYSKCMFCGICTEACPMDCIFMGFTHDLSCYSRDGCVVDFARLPLEIAWGAGMLNPTAVACSKLLTGPADPGQGRNTMGAQAPGPGDAAAAR